MHKVSFSVVQLPTGSPLVQLPFGLQGVEIGEVTFKADIEENKVLSVSLKILQTGSLEEDPAWPWIVTGSAVLATEDQVLVESEIELQIKDQDSWEIGNLSRYFSDGDCPSRRENCPAMHGCEISIVSYSSKIIIESSKLKPEIIVNKYDQKTETVEAPIGSVSVGKKTKFNKVKALVKKLSVSLTPDKHSTDASSNDSKVELQKHSQHTKADDFRPRPDYAASLFHQASLNLDIDETRRDIREWNVREAHKTLKKALIECRRVHNNQPHSEVAACLHQLGKACFEVAKFQDNGGERIEAASLRSDGMEHIKAAIAMYKQLDDNNSNASLAACWETLARIDKYSGDRLTHDDCLKEASSYRA